MKPRYDFSLFTEYDIFLFKKGEHYGLFEKMGAHPVEVDTVSGWYFAVWAPNAREVSVVGDFNLWDKAAHPMKARWDASGIWEVFIPGVEKGQNYKYDIASNERGYQVQKADPYAFYGEVPPKSASRAWDLDYQWQDKGWMAERTGKNAADAPMAIYEVHPGSWRRNPLEDNRSLTYRELAHELADYVCDQGFTHVELMPVMEHPFFGSWGYQITGYFSTGSRYGTPQDFMYLIDHLHQRGIGVILDWVPSHFPGDEHGLAYFDGTHLYEHADPKKGFHPDWNSFIFNYGRNEVQCFLLSNALFWLKVFHADGLRVDGVSSMLYLDFGRKEGEWIPNEHGGRENLDATDFLRRFNEIVYKECPDVQTIAEESTAWPQVTRPTYSGGLGFGLKWKMGWMHDTLDYFSQDSIHRKFHHDRITFSIWYAFTENYVLPLSHDEVVYGKGSLLRKMSGDDWQKFANLRLLYGFMYTHPGKKLLFMGSEFGQWNEWDHEKSLDWHLLDCDPNKRLLAWVRDLNRLYRHEPALFEVDFDEHGYQWIDCHDSDTSVISYLRRNRSGNSTVLVVCNATPVPRENYGVGVPENGFWEEILNSDGKAYGGSDLGNMGGKEAAPTAMHGHAQSLCLTLPPLAVVIFRKRSP